MSGPTITAAAILALREAGRSAYVYPRRRECSVDGGRVYRIVGPLPVPLN